MISFFKKKLKELKEYNRIANIDKIARRYFAMNSFDGVLTILGILIGSLFVGIKNSGIIIATSLGASIAMGISGIWGAYLTEHAERQKELHELERATLSKLGKTAIGRAAKTATFLVALVDGLSPFLAAMIIISPFLIGIGIDLAYKISIAIAFASLFVLGAFLGRISKENIFISGIKMLFAGLFVIILSMIFVR